MRRAELLFAVVVVLVLSAAWGLDRLIPAGGAAKAAARQPAGSPGLLSQAWYCPVPTSQGLASTISTVDLGRSRVHLRRSGTAPSAEADVAPGVLTAVPAAPAPATGTAKGPAIVEAFGQPTVSNLTVLNPTAGGATSRCSQQPGTRWLFALASTAPGYDSYLMVANPFLEEAVVTVRVLGARGDQVPPGLNDMQIPALSQTAVFLGDFYPQALSVGLDVTASRGRVVVGRLLKVASRDGVRGISLDVGAPRPEVRWIFPGGEVPVQGVEYVTVSNPSDREALVSMLFQTESGAPPAGSEDVPVPAGGQTLLKVSDRVPGGTRHGTIISSTNGVPVVAERMSIQGQGAAQSFQSTSGVRAAASRWLVPAGSAAGGADTLAIVADGPGKATCRITLMGAGGPSTPGPLANLEVGAGKRGTVDLTPYLGGQPAMVLVEAVSGRIAVENDVALPAAYRETMQMVGTPLG